MALVRMNELLKDAAKDDRAVGAFNVGNLEMIRGVVQAAEELNTPFIMQIAEVRLPYSPLHLMAPMMMEAARNAKVDVAVHLDHGKSFEVLKQALDYGFTSVMIDSSAYPYIENVERTKKARKMADEYNAGLEAELGIVGGNEGNGPAEEIKCTDPDEAGRFAAETGIDCLAVAIGNAHGNYPVAPNLRFDALEKIAEKTDVPLVLHGGTGITPESFRKAIHLGIRKINIATANFDSLTHGAEGYLETPGKHNYFKLNEAMIEGVYKNVKKHILIFNNETSLDSIRKDA